MQRIRFDPINTCPVISRLVKVIFQDLTLLSLLSSVNWDLSVPKSAENSKLILTYSAEPTGPGSTSLSRKPAGIASQEQGPGRWRRGGEVKGRERVVRGRSTLELIDQKKRAKRTYAGSV